MSRYFVRISDKTGHMVRKLSSFLAKDPIIVWTVSDSADTIFPRGEEQCRASCNVNVSW